MSINFDTIMHYSIQNPKIAKSFLEIFLQGAPDIMGEIKTSIEQSNLDELRKAFHRARPTYQMLGAQEFLDKMWEMRELVLNENVSHQEKQHILQQKYQELEHQYNDIILEVQHLFNTFENNS